MLLLAAAPPVATVATVVATTAAASATTFADVVVRTQNEKKFLHDVPSCAGAGSSSGLVKSR